MASPSTASSASPSPSVTTTPKAPPSCADRCKAHAIWERAVFRVNDESIDCKDEQTLRDLVSERDTLRRECSCAQSSRINDLSFKDMCGRP